jgi:hypothetical protein
MIGDVMDAVLTHDRPTETPAPEWTPPQVECYETRPEVTAYAGGGDPWTSH